MWIGEGLTSRAVRRVWKDTLLSLGRRDTNSVVVLPTMGYLLAWAVTIVYSRFFLLAQYIGGHYEMKARTRKKPGNDISDRLA